MNSTCRSFQMHNNMGIKTLSLLAFFICSLSASADFTSATARMAEDVRRGKPLFAHVTVALCDNASQGIVPVANGLCEGDAPERNLYWGALYGVKTYFSRHDEWTQIDAAKPADKRILDRVVFHRMLNYDGVSVPVYVIADAWRGKEIRSATAHFLEMTSKQEEGIRLSESLQLHENAHVIAYIGHNGLMDFSTPQYRVDRSHHSTSSAIILACKSDDYFAQFLAETKTYKLLTTTGLMAPEAYTLEAAITQWFSGGSPAETHLAASTAYSRYQRAKLTWSKGLFEFEKTYPAANK